MNKSLVAAGRHCHLYWYAPLYLNPYHPKEEGETVSLHRVWMHHRGCMKMWYITEMWGITSSWNVRFYWRWWCFNGVKIATAFLTYSNNPMFFPITRLFILLGTVLLGVESTLILWNTRWNKRLTSTLVIGQNTVL